MNAIKVSDSYIEQPIFTIRITPVNPKGEVCKKSYMLEEGWINSVKADLVIHGLTNRYFSECEINVSIVNHEYNRVAFTEYLLINDKFTAFHVESCIKKLLTYLKQKSSD